VRMKMMRSTHYVSQRLCAVPGLRERDQHSVPLPPACAFGCAVRSLCALVRFESGGSPLLVLGRSLRFPVVTCKMLGARWQLSRNLVRQRKLLAAWLSSQSAWREVAWLFRA
jgi:hypothetical protein